MALPPVMRKINLRRVRGEGGPVKSRHLAEVSAVLLGPSDEEDNESSIIAKLGGRGAPTAVL